MKFLDFICSEAIVADIEAVDRDGSIAELVCALENAGKLNKKEHKEIIKHIIKREKEASTGMGKGIAVPHVKYDRINNIIATVGCSKKGIDFQSLDNQPVYSIILLISPKDQPEKHLIAMEKIFQTLQQEKFRKFLRQADSAEQIEDLLKEVDENPVL